MPEAAASGSSVLRLDMLAVFQMNKSPVLRVSTENDMASTASVSPVRTALGYIFFPAQMSGAVAPVSRSAEYLHVVYEIAS